MICKVPFNPNRSMKVYLQLLLALNFSAVLKEKATTTKQNTLKVYSVVEKKPTTFLSTVLSISLNNAFV